MQTFLPYPSFEKSLKALDSRRLGKQRVEAFQILNIILNRTDKKDWSNHPAVNMWRGHANALKLYHNEAIKEWVARGYRNNMNIETIRGKIAFPEWFGKKNFHKSHKSNLLRKDKKFYSQFGWKVPSNLDYVWPRNKKRF